MSVVSAVPGKLISTTMQLPKAAAGPVRWAMRDNTGAIVAKGQCAPAGTSVIITVVLPTSVTVPIDGSKYSLSATDGITSAIEYFSVIPPQELQVSHSNEVGYLQGRVFRDSLITPSVAECISFQVVLADGTIAVPSTLLNRADSCGVRNGESFIYSLDYKKYAPSVNPPGSINTRTGNTLGIGTVIWDYTLCTDVEPTQELHALYTITPYSSTFLNAIKKMVDKARIGDVNQFLKYTMTDLAHALIRGCDVVMMSPPVATGFFLDTLPVMLRDYIVKAAAIDILRAEYEAEGMSTFDFQGLGTQLNVDRTQYLDNLIQQLSADMANLPAAKNEWLAQNAPMGGTIQPGKRPIGVLALSRGVYSTQPMYPLPIVMGGGGYSFTPGGQGYGPVY